MITTQKTFFDFNQPPILGIDASLTNTGIALINLNGKLIHSDTISPKSKGTYRLIYHESSLEKLIFDYSPQIAVMEGYAYSPNAGMAFNIGELGGIYKTQLWKNRIPLYIVAPTTLKKFATGSGKGDKNKIMLNVYREYGLEFKDDDQTDAFVLSQIGLKILQYKHNSLPKNTANYKLEVIKTILKNESKIV